MAPEVKTPKNSKFPKLPESYFEPVGKDGWPPISIWIIILFVDQWRASCENIFWSIDGKLLEHFLCGTLEHIEYI